MCNIESRTESETHDRFKIRPQIQDKAAFDSIVAQHHIHSEFFSRLLERQFGNFAFEPRQVVFGIDIP
jgi:hypothetical protein